MILVDEIFTADPMVHSGRNPLARQAARHGKQWCHMWSDTHNMEELVAVGKSIGLRAEWLQRHPGFPHFDLIPSKRALAIKKGAKTVNLLQWLREMSKESPQMKMIREAQSDAMSFRNVDLGTGTP